MKKICGILAVLLTIALPAAAACAETAPDEAEAVYTNYTFTFTDQFGAPVEGVIVSVCGALFCAPVISDADGIAVFEGEPFAYEVHILALPEGYSFEPAQDFMTEEVYGNMDFVLTKL